MSFIRSFQRISLFAGTLAALWGFSGMGFSQQTQSQEQDTTLIAHFMNGNTAQFHSRVYLWNPSDSAGDINAKVYSLPQSGSFSLDSLLLGEVNLGILGAESARMIKLSEDVLTPLGMQTPYLEDGGNLTLELHVDAPNVQGSAQVFSTNFDFAFGTYPLNAVPAKQEPGDVANFLTQNVLSQFRIRIEPVGGIPFDFIPNEADWRYDIRKVWDGWDDGHVTVLVGVSGGTIKDWGDYPTDYYFLITDWPDEDSYMVDIVAWGSYQTRIFLNDREVLLMKGWETSGSDVPMESYVVVKVKKPGQVLSQFQEDSEVFLTSGVLFPTADNELQEVKVVNSVDTIRLTTQEVMDVDQDQIERVVIRRDEGEKIALRYEDYQWIVEAPESHKDKEALSNKFWYPINDIRFKSFEDEESRQGGFPEPDVQLTLTLTDGSQRTFDFASQDDRYLVRKVDSGRQGTISQEDFEKLHFKVEDIL